MDKLKKQTLLEHVPELAMKDQFCCQVPPLVSAFVDAFVDHAFSGEFVGPVVPDGAPNIISSPFKRTSHELDYLMLPPWCRLSPPIITRLNSPRRLVAIGDIHGDVAKATEALRIGGLIDENSKWIGGETMLVQVGDIFDRGASELKIIYLMERLKREALRAGGAVHLLHGNHELMNITFDFRYYIEDSVDEFLNWAKWYEMGNVLKERCRGIRSPHDFFYDLPKKISIKRNGKLKPIELDNGFRARMAALRPGGPISARFLASNPSVLVVGDTIFVHGGLHETYHKNLEKINDDVCKYVLGKVGRNLPSSVGPHGSLSKYGLLWSREYSAEPGKNLDCELLDRTLRTVPGAKRMVMGHSPQELGINTACNGQACRIDVGMSTGVLDGEPQVLEIYDGELTVLTADGPLPLLDVGEFMMELEPPSITNEETIDKLPISTTKEATSKLPTPSSTSRSEQIVGHLRTGEQNDPMRDPIAFFLRRMQAMLAETNLPKDERSTRNNKHLQDQDNKKTNDNEGDKQHNRISPLLRDMAKLETDDDASKGKDFNENRTIKHEDELESGKPTYFKWMREGVFNLTKSKEKDGKEHIDEHRTSGNNVIQHDEGRDKNQSKHKEKFKLKLQVDNDRQDKRQHEESKDDDQGQDDKRERKSPKTK